MSIFATMKTNNLHSQPHQQRPQAMYGVIVFD